jgi:DNA-binding response OmpR family regulator
MPRLGGRDLAELLRQKRPNMTVLFISGYSGDTSAPDLWRWDGRLLLRKPFAPIDLVIRIRDLLDHPGNALDDPFS